MPGMDRYFDFLKKNLASIPTGGTELGEKFKDYTDNNITSMQDFLKRISAAKNFQDVMRIQTEFSQMTTFGDQARGFAEAYAKVSTDSGEKRG